MLFVDATFKTKPNHFYQILNILVDFQGTVIPVVHVVMTGKKESLYRAVFQKFKDLVDHQEWTPTQVMIDFETALGTTLIDTFPGIRVTGCRFHFGQANLKKIRSSKIFSMAREYGRDLQMTKLFRKHCALALLPAEHIIPTFNLLKQETLETIEQQYLKRKFILFQQYFERYWIRERRPELWSNFGLQHRTNNNCESLHSRYTTS